MSFRVLCNKAEKEIPEPGLLVWLEPAAQCRKLHAFVVLRVISSRERIEDALTDHAVGDVNALENRHSGSFQVVRCEYSLVQVAEDHLVALFIGQDRPR